MLRIKLISCLSAVVLLTACSSTPTVEQQPIEEEAHYQPIHITSSKTIPSDVKNANYSDSTTTTTTAKVPLMPELKTEPTPKLKKSIPIIRETPKSYAPSVNYLALTVLFDNGGSTIAPSYRYPIARIAKLAKDHNAQIHIYGHSSSRTQNTTISQHKEINFNTSLKRAKAVAAALRNAGVKKGNITIEAMSDLHPLFSEAMPEGEHQNRRAEIYVSY